MLPLIKTGTQPLFPQNHEMKSATVFPWGVFRILYASLFVFALIMSPGIQRANGTTLDFDKISKIPDYSDELSQKDFKELSREYRVKTKGDRHLEFSVRIPKNWSRSHSDLTAMEVVGAEKKTDVTSVEIKKKLLGKVATFHGPPRLDNISYFDVEVLNLEYNISTRNWILNYVVHQGITLQGMREVSKDRFELLFNKVIEGVPYVVRMVGEANGSRIMMASYYMPEQYWQEERAQQQRVVNSFELLNPEERNIEKNATYQFLDLVHFDYPVSWKLLAPKIYSVDEMEARIINTPDGNTLNGEIRLTILANDLDISLEDEVTLIHQNLQNMGIEINRLKTKPGVDLNYQHYDHIYWKKIEIYSTKREAGDEYLYDYDFWLGVFLEDRYYYIITMLTPSRENDFLSWARNIEAYQTVVESIRP